MARDKYCNLPAVRVKKATREKVAEIAERRDVPMAQVMREAVEFFLSKSDNFINSNDNRIIEKGV